MKNYQVIEKILKYHPNIPDYQGCDEYKSGDPQEECKGIAVALVPTVEVIRKMVEKGCNLLITHEPIFYQTPDYPKWKGSYSNAVYEKKLQLLQESHITVWRDHDHIHSHQPDGIFTGVLRYLGWEKYYMPAENQETAMYYTVEIPKTTVGELGRYLIEKLNLNGLRYMGNPGDTISRIALVGHLYPNSFYPDGIDDEGYYQDYAMKLMEQMEKEHGIEAIIPGEIIEWTILSYIRDAIAMGNAKACYNIGHFNLEELGMRYAKDWISEIMEYKLPVHYIPTKDAFSYL